MAWKLYQDRKKCSNYDLYLFVKEGKRLTPDQFSRALQVKTSHYIGLKLSIAPTHHIMIAFMRAFLELKMIEKGNNIRDLMSSHFMKVAYDYYTMQIGNLEGVTDRFMFDVQQFCDSYHNAIGLGERTGPLIANLMVAPPELNKPRYGIKID